MPFCDAMHLNTGYRDGLEEEETGRKARGKGE
jgi:hypothetical protein